VAYTAIGKNDGHIPPGGLWLIEWLPKGYGPTPNDKLVCVFPDQGWRELGHHVKEGGLPPLIEAVVKVIEDYMLTHGQRE
jgi:hypothetical protein